MSELVFQYTARSGSGNIVTGSMRAVSRRDVIAHLRARRLFVTSLKVSAGAKGKLRTALARTGFGRASRATLLRSLAVLVGAGTSLQRAFTICIEQCRDGRFRETLVSIAAELDAGTALSEAMAHHPADFPAELVAMIRSGELGGVLEDVLSRCAMLLERRRALRRQLSAALAYPCFVLTVAVGLLTFMLVATVPAFGAILAELHTKLPFSTRLILGASTMLRSPRILAPAAFALTGMIAAIAICSRNAGVGAAVARATLRIPLIGGVQRCANMAAFARTSGMLLECGVIITDAVHATRTVLANKVYQRAIQDIERELEEGRALAPALQRTGLFEHLAVQLVAVGEEAGSLDAMLLRIAEHHETEMSEMLRSLTAVLEPALIVMLGGVIGTIVGSILIPLYGAIGNVR